MNTARLSGSWLRRSCLTLGVILLAYAILLRGLAAPLPAMPGSIEAALTNPHYFCLTDGTDGGVPRHDSSPCGECCLGLARADTPQPATASITMAWPRLVWRPGAPARAGASGGPHEEAWTRAHSQRGPPESRTPTSFT